MGNIFALCDPPRRRLPDGSEVRMVKPTNLVPIPSDARRRALLIGINYAGQGGVELDGCVNDAQRMLNFLKERKFEEENIRVLTDEQKHIGTLHHANRANILIGMKWLAYGAQPGDSLFFFFAGHGSQVKDTSGDEVDGLDETILPCDYKKQGQIIDDIMWEILVRPLPAGCRLTAVMDCCHSGTGLDLPYGLCPTKKNWEKLHRKKPSEQGAEEMYEDTLQALGMEDFSDRLCDADVLLLSGCADEETSADTTDVREITSVFEEPPLVTHDDDDLAPLDPQFRPPCSSRDNDLVSSLDDGNDWLTTWITPNKTKQRSANTVEYHSSAQPAQAIVGRAGGALTTALTVLVKSIEERKKVVKYNELLYGIREVLDQLEFSQVPQLSGSKPFRMDVLFQL